MPAKMGDVIFYKDIPVLTSRIQQFVLGIPYSHNGIYIGKNALGRHQEFEANIEVATTTFTYNAMKRELWSINAPEEVLIHVINRIVDDFEEELYGFISWPAILIRKILEILGHEDAKSWNILWGWGIICSELIYYYFYELGKTMNWTDLLEELDTFNPNLFHPGDTKYILLKFPQYFSRNEMIVY